MGRRETVAEFFARAIDFSGKSQREIALEAGFEHPNVISMMGSGDMKIPLERVPVLATPARSTPPISSASSSSSITPRSTASSSKPSAIP